MGYNVNVARTPLVYYGGKSGMWYHIEPLIPAHEVYTEAFLGGGAVFWNKRKAKNETINDIRGDVINFYEQVKTNFDELKKLIDASLISRTHHKRAQQILKDRNSDPTRRAWALWYIVNFSFSNKIGGGIKYSNDQHTVVPEQLRNKKQRFTSWLVRRIEDAHIENQDALVVLRSRNVEKAFHYIDPPYFNADMGHYKGYTRENFRELLEWCEKECKGRFLLSNYNSDLLDEYLARNPHWNKKQVTKRLQAPMVKVKDKTEVLVWNYDVHQAHGQKKLF